MKVTAELVPHLVEVLRHPQFRLVAVGPLPLAEWNDHLRSRIEGLGGEWLTWPPPRPIGAVCILTDVNVAGVPATLTAGDLVEAVVFRSVNAIEVSAGWHRSAERMCSLLGGTS
jgi:hypothetical protein